MTRLKKSLAMLLVFAMMFSTMSVAASAWKTDSDDDNDIRFTVQFFREDASGNWVNVFYDDPTTEEVERIFRAAPGDKVQARVYAETTFPTGSVTDAIVFDENYFVQNIGTGAFVTNSNPNINSYYTSQGYKGTISWRTDESLHRQNLGNALVKYLASKGYSDSDYAKYDTESNTFAKSKFDVDYFNHTDIMIINAYTQGVNNKALPELAHNEDGTIAEDDLGKWIFAYDLKVRDDRRAVILDTAEAPNKGYAKVPEMYSKQSEYPLSYYDAETGKTLKPAQFVDYGRGPEDADSGACNPMTTWEEDPDFSTQAGYVSTTSYITFDPNGGTFADGSTSPKTVAGIIDTSASVSFTEEDALRFAGWELVSGSDNSVNFDYANKVLKATWTETDPVKTTYIKRFWEMNTNGVYEIKMASDPIETTEGETISADAPAAKEGFYIDEETVKTPEKSVLSQKADKDSSKNVLDVYYARNDYTVTYNYEDNGGKHKQVDYPIYHGAALPPFLEGTNGEVPAATGKDFSAWSYTENGDAINELPATVESNLTFHATYVNETYSYYFHANVEGDNDGKGAFNDGSKIIRLVFEYGKDPAEVAAQIKEFVSDPSKPGYEFDEWESYSTTPTADVDIYPVYSQLDYEVRFFDKDGNLILNTRDEDLIFFYGEFVEADKHIPEGYKSYNSWTLKDSSATVSFPYEVTDNVDFYAEDSANVYDARFYINNELYTTVPTVYDGKIEIPDYEPAEGYDFSGWDTTVEGTGEYMDNVNGKDFYATLTPKDIEITFEIEGQEDTVINGKFGENVTGIPVIPAKEGYEAGVWSPDAPATFPSEDTTYTATWEPKTNTLTFVDIDENGVESNLGTISAKTDETITAQSDPKKAGHTFKGWLCEDGKTIATAPTVMPAKSQKYVAQWDVNTHSFSFDANGGAFAEGAVTEGTVNYGTTVAVPVPELEGYVFAGWADSNVENPTATDVILSKDATSIVLDANVAYKAVWTKSVHTVTYDAVSGLITNADGSRTSKIEIPVAYGDKVPTVNDPVLDDNKFIKWVEKDSGIAIPDSMPNKSLYFVAQYEPLPNDRVEYKIYSVKQVEGSNEYADPVLVKTSYALPGTQIKVVTGDPANENEYKFSSLVPNPSQVLDDSKPTSMVISKDGKNELYIYSNLAEFTVTFTTGDGTWADGSTEDYTTSGKFGYEITAPAEYPEKKGYTCIGWEGFTKGDTFAKDITVTPIWEIKKNDANFVVVDEEGNVKASETVEFEYGKEIILPTIVIPEGYEYVDGQGWNDVIPENATMGEEVVTYTATIKPIDYTINYVITNSDVAAAPEAQKFNVGDDVTVKAATEVEGYDFIGWKTEDGVTYEAGYVFDDIKPGSFTLTGTYDPKEFSIQFDTNGSGFVPSERAEVGSPITELPEIPDDPDDDKLPLGWYNGEEKVELPFNMPAEDLILTAKYSYKVSYEYTGTVPEGAPNVPATRFVEPGKTVDIEAAPVLEGYTFSGWYNGEELAESFTMQAQGVKLTGSWSSNAPDEYTITYKYTGDTPAGAPAAPAPHAVKEGTTVTPEIPKFDGYTFDGWYLDGEPVTSFVPEKDSVLTGHWTKNAQDTFNVEYAYTGNIPEGAPEAPKAELVKAGTTVTPEIPKFDGYTFDGWYLDGKPVTSFVPEKDSVLTGSWTKNAQDIFNITYVYNEPVPEGAPEAPAATTAKVGDNVTVEATPEFEGYTFNGWFDANGAKVTEFTMPAKDVTLSGYWTKNAQDTFNVKYAYTGEVPEGAPEAPAATTAKVGDNVTVEADPKLDGYIFNGWYLDDVESTSFEMPAKDVTLTGHWTKAPVVIVKKTLTLDPNGGNLKGSTEVFVEEYEVGTDIPPVVDPVRPGFRFIRWVDAEGNTGVVPGTMPNYNVTLTAEWEQLYTVTYVNEDGTVYEEFVEAGIAGESIPAPTKGNPDKDGHRFVQWVDVNTGNPVTEIPVGGVTLKPVFVKIEPDTYAVTYAYTNAKVPAGAPALPTTDYIKAGETVTVAEVPSLKGYDFEGWNIEGVTITDNTFVMPAEDVTIKGTWTVKEFSVVLDATIGAFENGQSQFVEDVEYGAELKDIIPANPVKTGYTFVKWVDDKGNEVVIPATMPDSDIEAKAEWKINSHDIIFDSLGGTEVDDITLEYGAEIKDLPKPTKEGFEFIGWFDKDGNKVDAEGATMPDHDIEAFAKWEAIIEIPKHELTIDANEGKFSDGEDKHTYPEIEEGASLKDYLADKPEKDGYEFIGWFDENGNKIDEETAVMGSGDMTIVAGWEVIKYTITYYIASGENVSEYDSEEYAPGETIVDPAKPVLEGFTFVGWFDKDGKELPDVMEEKDLEAYAKFDINTYKVTYLVNGTVYAEYDVLYQEKVPVPTDPESNDPNLVFAGWNPTLVSVMPAKNLVYTADFASLEEDKYVAKFVVDGKTWDFQVLAEGEEIVLPENPTKFGHKFVGWKPDVPAYMPAEDMEFVAQWEVDETFIIIAVGGTVIAGGIIAGSIIGGNAAWITGVSIVGGIIAIVGVAALVKHTHTVTYIVDGEIYKSYKVVEGTKIPVPAEPVKDGFKFDGWNPEVPEKMGNTDLTFEATWVEAGSDNGADDSDTDVAIPDTGSVAGGLAAFAIISGAAAAAYVLTRKKKED